MTGDSLASQSGGVIALVDAGIEDLVPGFLERRRKDVETIVAACEQGDYETIRVLGHNMKGTGDEYGFGDITDIGRSIEQSAMEQNPERIRKLVGDLSTYLKRVEVVYA